MSARTLLFLITATVFGNYFSYAGEKDSSIVKDGNSNRLDTVAAASSQETSSIESELYYYHSSQGSSTSYITDAAGLVCQHLEYFAFGETFVEERTGSNTTDYKFNGKELDEETGLYYYGARYQHPQTSVWLSVDPLADNYPGLSPYNFALNNPVNLTDPDGRGPVWNTVKKVGAFAIDRGIGVLQAVGGGMLASSSAAFGASTSWTGAGLVVGVGGVALGFDQFQTGIRRIAYGGNQLSGYNTLLQQAGLPEEVASNVEAVTLAVFAFAPQSLAINAQRQAIGEAVKRSQKLILVGKATTTAEVAALRSIPEKAGYFDVVIHGALKGYGVQLGGIIQGGNSLAEVILESGMLPKGQAIRLVSCSAGAVDAGVAQAVADRTGRVVLAATDTVWVNAATGEILGVGPSLDKLTGMWRQFFPK